MGLPDRTYGVFVGMYWLSDSTLYDFRIVRMGFSLVYLGFRVVLMWFSDSTYGVFVGMHWLSDSTYMVFG